MYTRFLLPFLTTPLLPFGGSAASEPALATAPLVLPLPDCGACSIHTGGSFVQTLSAEPLLQGQWAASLRVDVIDSDPYSDSELIDFAENDVHAHSVDRSVTTRLNLVHGLSSDLTVGLDLPWVSNQGLREAHHDEEGGGEPELMDLGDSQGLGDLALFGKYRLAWDGESSTSLYFGAELPTGKTDVRKLGERLETHHQPGSGSLDPLLGIAYARQHDDQSWGASLLYTFAGDGSQDSNLGDVLRASVGWSYALSRSVDGAAKQLLLELAGQWHERRSEDGVEDGNSGGFQLLLAPGFQARTASGWSWFASLGIPVVDDLNGEQVETDWRASVGLGFAW